MKGIVYMIEDDDTKEKYIGSTTLSLVKRMGYHSRENNSSSAKLILKNDNYSIKVLERLDVLNTRYLREREQYYLDKYKDNNIVNKRRAIPKIQEWENPYYFR